MTAYDFDIGIIGGGAAGLTIASGAARLGAKTLLVEKEKALGGDCLHYGCVPSKTLIRTARVRHLMARAAEFGLPQTALQPVDFREVAKRIQAVIAAIQQHDSAERFCRLGARVLFGQPEFSDAHTIRLNGNPHTAKYWVIASGSSAAVPPIVGLQRTPYITNREIFALDRLPASMIVLGAGPIGIEMSQAFSRLGTRVTVVDMAGQVLAKEDRDMADGVMAALQAEGVVFHLNSAVVSTRDLGTQREAVIQGPDGQQVALQAETLLVAVGRVPNTGGLGLEKIGVQVDTSGVQVDKRLRTSRKHIYAAGDVTGGYQFTHAAGYEGGIVVSNAVFHLRRKVDYTWLPWCTYTDPELASIGMNEKAAAAAGIDYTRWEEPFEDNDRSLAEGQRAGKIKMILDARDKPIGVQILGPHAGELINEWVAVLNGKVKLSTLASAVHPYPTLGEISRKVVGSYFSPKVFSPTVKKSLKFFFHLKGRACGCGHEDPACSAMPD
jgi:pyruvate/2-oxoglutarate dehydrogenase complex dihydrolipoamide dehydrogenase (E3) component